MSFLSTAILWGLFAAAIPVIIHLLNRRRFRTIKWAATTFLLKASRESRGKKKLRHILILTCRALAIAALIFAVARPLVGGFLGFGGASVETVILILDRSASMETKPGSGEPSFRQAVLNQVSETIAQLGSPRLLLLDSATGEVQEVPSPDVLDEISTTQATDTQANIPNLLTTALEYLQKTNPGKTEIWLASDQQSGDWQPSDSKWGAIRGNFEDLPNPPKLRLLTLGEKPVENFALELLASRRVDDHLFLDLRLTRSLGEQSTTLPITFSLRGARSSDQVTITGQELRFQKRIPLTATDTTGYGFVALPSDNNPRDNSVYFSFGEKRDLESWIVAEDPASETADFLRRAAAPVGFDRHQAQVITPNQTNQIKWNTASLIIWQAPIPVGADATRLTEFVNSGGSLLFFPPETDSPQGFFGSSWGDLQESPADKFFINGSWLKDDGPWQNGINDATLPVDQIRAIRRRTIIGDGSSLAEWDDGSPLLYRQLEGLGTIIFISTLPIDRWSNLEFTALHLVAIQRLIENGSDRLEANLRAFAGSDQAKPTDEEVTSRLDSFEDFDPALAHYRAGVYRMGERTVALNRPRDEISPEKIDSETLDQLLEGTSYSKFANDSSDETLVSEAWRAFLIAVILFLIAEALLCLQPKTTGPPALRSQSKPKPSPIS